MDSDLNLLSRYHRLGDAEAFQALVSAHAAMVHGTAQRITHDAVLAQDVAQETFLALARSGGAAIRSVGAWLHHVALMKAQNAVRAEARRLKHESAAANLNQPDADSSWAEIEPLLDETLAELPEASRALLIERYLEGSTQQEMAARLGVSQSTVSRQLDDAIHQLRQRLNTKGMIGVASLALILSSHPAHAAPPALTAALGKIAMSGVGANTALGCPSVVTTALVSMTATTKALLVTGTLAAVALPFVLHRRENNPAPVNRPSVAKGSAAKPKAKTPEMSDEELFNHLFGSGSDRLKNARTLVDDYRAAHPGLSLTELAKDPALTPKLQSLMHDMMTTSGLGTEFADAIQLAMQVKGIKPSPGTNVNVNMSEGFLNTESQAERYLGAVLANDAKALAQLFADVVNEAAAEMALDPRVDKSFSGVSINNAPPPPGAKIIQKEPKD